MDSRIFVSTLATIDSPECRRKLASDMLIQIGESPKGKSITERIAEMAAYEAQEVMQLKLEAMSRTQAHPAR